MNKLTTELADAVKNVNQRRRETFDDDWNTIRSELHRLTEIAATVDPLVIRLGEVTTRLEAANRLLLKFAEAVRDTAFKMSPPNPWTPIFVQLAQASEHQSHLQGAGDEA